jgi:hypothetical protein
MRQLLVGLRRAPWLELVGPQGRRPLPNVHGTPFRVRVGARGHWAYVALGGDRATALTVHDPSGAVLDLRPGAVISGAPAFHPDGGSLCYVREAPDERRELVRLDLDSGSETVRLSERQLRCCAWQGPERLVVSLGDRIELVDVQSGTRSTLVRDEVATGFAAWGTDDLYVTLDEVCSDAQGRLAWTRYWHEQGRASRGEVHVRDGRGERTIPRATRARLVHGDVAVLRGSAIVGSESGSWLDGTAIEDFDVVAT